MGERWPLREWSLNEFISPIITEIPMFVVKKRAPGVLLKNRSFLVVSFSLFNQVEKIKTLNSVNIIKICLKSY